MEAVSRPPMVRRRRLREEDDPCAPVVLFVDGESSFLSRLCRGLETDRSVSPRDLRRGGRDLLLVGVVLRLVRVAAEAVADAAASAARGDRFELRFGAVRGLSSVEPLERRRPLLRLLLAVRGRDGSRLRGVASESSSGDASTTVTGVAGGLGVAVFTGGGSTGGGLAAGTAGDAVPASAAAAATAPLSVMVTLFVCVVWFLV